MLDAHPRPRSTAAYETGDAKERLAAVERRANAQVGAAVAARDEAVQAAKDAESETRRVAAERIAAAEEEARKAREALAALTRERDEVSSRLVAVQQELLDKTRSTSEQVETSPRTLALPRAPSARPHSRTRRDPRRH
jgi:hypothetical protein